MNHLLALQQRFREALTTNTDTLADLVPDAARRLSIHRTTIEAGLNLTLSNVFPALRRVVGASTFALLASDFMRANPPRAPVLAAYGRDFPGFVARQPIGATLPYLHDLARLEWARQEAYLAADAAPLDAARLDLGDADALSALAFRAHPAMRLMTSSFPIHRIWRVNQSDIETKDIPTVDMSVAEHVIVTRPRAEVITRAVSLADATMVRTLANGAPLNSAVEAAFAISAAFDVAAALAGHFANGTFAGNA